MIFATSEAGACFAFIVYVLAFGVTVLRVIALAFKFLARVGASKFGLIRSVMIPALSSCWLLDIKRARFGVLFSLLRIACLGYRSRLRLSHSILDAQCSIIPALRHSLLLETSGQVQGAGSCHSCQLLNPFFFYRFCACFGFRHFSDAATSRTEAKRMLMLILYVNRCDDAARLMARDAVSEDRIIGTEEMREARWAVALFPQRPCLWLGTAG